MSRKQQLRARAVLFSNRYRKCGLVAVWRAQDGFEAGYRAAMRDARKAASADIDLRAPTPASNMNGAAWDLFPTIRAFLRPLR